MTFEFTPGVVSGGLPRDLFNYGARQAARETDRAQPKLDLRVIDRRPEGDIMHWRIVVESLQGGLNLLEGDYASTFDRIHSGDVDGRHSRNAHLPLLTESQSNPVVSSPIIGMHSAMFNNLLHVGIGAASPETVNFVTSASEEAVAQIYRVTGWHGTTAPAAGTAATGNNLLPDPPSLNPSAWDVENTLWIAGFGMDANNPSMTKPTSYTTGAYSRSSAAATAASLGTAWRGNLVASEDPAQFQVSGLSEEWVANTVSVRPGIVASPSGPALADDTTTLFPSETTSHAVTMPTTVNAGELLLVDIHVGSDDTSKDYAITTPTGWTQVIHTTLGYSSGGESHRSRVGIFAKVADGTEDGTTVDFVTELLNLLLILDRFIIKLCLFLLKMLIN